MLSLIATDEAANCKLSFCCQQMKQFGNIFLMNYLFKMWLLQFRLEFPRQWQVEWIRI